MKNISRRSRALYLLCAVMAAGILLLCVRLVIDGEAWAAFRGNTDVYTNGSLSVGSLYDRNGVALSVATDGVRHYSDEEIVRRATLHLVGDRSGNIGTGALTALAPKLIGYSILSGVYSRAGTGRAVTLTVDAKLNTVAYSALNGQRGCVAVMDYKTGEIIALVSSPTFDPLSPPNDIESDPAYEGVYLNRALSSAYPPGSTFKLITAAAAIERDADIGGRVFHCAGSLDIGGDTVTCTRTHGELGFADALAVSCNVVFAQLSLELGADTLASYAQQYGLTESFSIDGISTAAGHFDKGGENSANLAWSGVGQYNDLTVPVAMLRYVAAIANGGVAVNMSVIKKNAVETALSFDKDTQLIESSTSEKLAYLLRNNVRKNYGADNFPGLELHAKSGTAEVDGGKKPHSWFVGYITNDNHPLAFVVIVENGGSGVSAAGGVANKVLSEAIS